MSKKPVKISTLLTRAAKHLEENGWVKGNFWIHRNGKLLWSTRTPRSFDEQLEVAREKGCPACARGALYIADREVDPSDVAHRELRHEEAERYIAQANPAAKWVAMWNDKPERTKEEVVQTLKEAAKAARKDGK